MATKFDAPDFSFIVKRESTVLIPLKNAFFPKVSDLTVTIYPRSSENYTIKNVKLYTTSDSILSYYGNFMLDNKTTTADKLPVYKMNVYAQHSLQVQNTTNLYSVATYFLNGSGNLVQNVVSFAWPIKTLDFSLLTYFWIVLIGVVVSRFTTRYIKDRNLGPGSEAASAASRFVIYLQLRDYLWIAFSAIIALLIFAQFQKNVELTSNIITNISLAFGFGFGFDRILDVGQELQARTE